LSDEKWQAAAISRTLLKIVGEPEDIAYCALYLASNESKWVTGINIVLDGGSSAW